MDVYIKRGGSVEMRRPIAIEGHYFTELQAVPTTGWLSYGAFDPVPTIETTWSLRGTEHGVQVFVEV